MEQVAWTTQREFSLPVPKYRESSITTHEYEIIKDECMKPSAFDSKGLRNEIFNRAFNLKTTPIIVKESEEGKIIAMLDNIDQLCQIPWNLWFRVLRMFYRGKKFCIFFLAHTSLRTFPKTTLQPIQPFNINGGYTYPCDHTCICIYRAEDATRVLIHELFHSSCSDDRNESIDMIEAKTEAWAELFYASLMAEGNHSETEKNIKRQAAWIASQNKYLRMHYIRSNSTEFPWRYTIGKEYIWKKWGIYPKGVRPVENKKKSLRLTPPPTEKQLEKNGLPKNSTIL